MADNRDGHCHLANSIHAIICHNAHCSSVNDIQPTHIGVLRMCEGWEEVKVPQWGP